MYFFRLLAGAVETVLGQVICRRQSAPSLDNGPATQTCLGQRGKRKHGHCDRDAPHLILANAPEDAGRCSFSLSFDAFSSYPRALLRPAAVERDGLMERPSLAAGKW